MTEEARKINATGVVQAPDTVEHVYGSLIIDLVEAGTREVVFRGTGKTKLNAEEKTLLPSS